MNTTQLVKQAIAQLNQQQMTVVKNPPKPIFVMKIPNTIVGTDLSNLRDAVAKDSISDEYHILVIPNVLNEYGFEMYNADKIERQEWNEIVNKFIK